jgi:hypothetical protein
MVAEGRESFLKTHLGVQERVNHLELGRGFEMGHPGIFEGKDIIGGGMQVDIHQSGHESASRHGEHLRPFGDRHLSFCPDRLDPLSLHQDTRISPYDSSLAIQEPASFYDFPMAWFAGHGDTL